MTITEFLLARIAEDETAALDAGGLEWRAETIHHPELAPAVLDANGWGIVPNDATSPPEAAIHIARHHPARVLAECEAKRRIVEFHQSWPVLVSQPLSFDRVESDDVQSLTFRASQRIAWATEQEYRAKFGDEPPTAPMLLALASVYADHPDYDPAWRVAD